MASQNQLLIGLIIVAAVVILAGLFLQGGASLAPQFAAQPVAVVNVFPG